MNKGLKRLFALADQREKIMVGLISGTSHDGLDIAVCRITGADFQTEVELLHFTTISYPEEIESTLEELAFRRKVDQQSLCVLNRRLGQWYGEQVKTFIRKCGLAQDEVDLIASHGQTVYHVPDSMKNGPVTLQIGDGDHIAESTGIPTLSDFRQKPIAAGGEGAPLTPFVDRLIFGSASEPRILLNIGGIANYTWLDRYDKHQKHEYLYSDTGPGNTLINATVRHYYDGYSYDPEGSIARRGTVGQRLLNALLDHPFFDQPAPKSTGPETFSLQWVFETKAQQDLAPISPEDLIATLTRLSVESIARGLERIGQERLQQARLYVSGGGYHNETMMEWLEKRLRSLKVECFDQIGVTADAREALSFAVLANQSISGSGIPVGIENKFENRMIHPGKISTP